MEGKSATPPVTPERIMQFAFGYAPPLMVEAAVRHRVFDLLDEKPMTLQELIAATGTSHRGLRALADALVSLQFVVRDAQGRHTLTPESAAFLVSTKPSFVGGMFRHTSTQLLPRWLNLTEVVRTGQPAAAFNQEGQGTKFFEQFVEDLFPFNYGAAKTLANTLEVSQAAKPISVLDLAAGSGVWGIAMAQQSPQVRVTAVDWPGVIPVTRRVATRFGLQDRFRFVEGDLRDADFGSGHHVAILGHILHSEGEERSRALLKKTFAAMSGGGTIAIAEWLVNEERSGPTGATIFAINMLVNTDRGDTFSFGEIRGWLEEAGFVNARLVEVPGPSPLILATKPGG